MGKVLTDLKPEFLWKHFEEICSYPRPSRKEEKVAAYVAEVGKKNGLEVSRDDFGNILVKKPATTGMENLQTVVLQGHLDMVAEKNSDVQHDFDNDPIQPYVEGNWVKAKGTTLGSDNGIGVAAALAIMEDKNVKHGPLEFLFTLDEETGLNGAQSLKPGWLKAKILLNLDSEEDGALYIGCAGGKNTYADFKFIPENTPADSLGYQINVTGLKGGHSGLDISEGRGNAIKIITRLLWTLSKKNIIRLAKIDGGSKHNAIPRECFAVVAVNTGKENEFLKEVEEYNSIVKKELATNEPNLKVDSVKVDLPAKVLDVKTETNLLNSLYGVAHGVITMSPDILGLVETSTNLAVIVTEANSISITTSQRSSVESEKDDIANMVSSVFQLANAEVRHGDAYPGWKPNVNSPILNVMKSVYTKMYEAEPHIKAIHAGLECGIINERYPDMDMISFGPTIMGAHSPDERVKIDTVKKFWDLLLNVLQSIPKQ